MLNINSEIRILFTTDKKEQRYKNKKINNTKIEMQKMAKTG